MQLYGIHHLTAITANARGNHAFYTDVLGMRLVKKTVNQDDVSAYHLFYADGKGSPGTDLTFFDWPAVPERRGTHSIVGTGLRVGGEAALQWWMERFENRQVRHRGIVERDGRLTLDFEDPEGQRLSFIDDGASGEASALIPRGPDLRSSACSTTFCGLTLSWNATSSWSRWDFAGEVPGSCR
jgi:glyoxalase family protein